MQYKRLADGDIARNTVFFSHKHGFDHFIRRIIIQHLVFGYLVLDVNSADKWVIAQQQA